MPRLISGADLDATAPGVPRDPTAVDPDAMPERIGRFRVLERAGRGAMGIVYAAYDPELDRRVAIKLVLAHVADSADYAERLRREARTMARVVHANVVAVHDVGIFHDRPFIAMDFVAGADLRAHLRSTRPRWPTIVELFVQAARGLAAAHAVGVIHRDFKPDNVLVSIGPAGDTVVRVADFGLAAAGSATTDAGRADESGAVVGAELPLYTRSGAGTPAYMAAERWKGETAGPASDQFSFCVALFEALADKRPFIGDSVPALCDAITSGRRESIPDKTDVPRWIWAAIERGLSSDPSARHPDMHALVTALLADPRRRRRRIAAVALAGAAVVGTLGALELEEMRARSECGSDASSAVDEFWSAERQDVLARAFARVDTPYAADAWGRTQQALAHHADRLREARRELCVVHEVDHAIEDDLFARRADCLDVRQLAAEVLVTQLEAVDTASVASAAEMARGLPPVAQCEDTRTLYERAALPADPDTRARIGELRRATLELGTRRLGRWPLRDALPRALDLVERADDLGDDSTTAAALMELAAHQGLLARHDDAEASVTRAIEVASRAHDAVFEADAWLMMLWLVGEREPARVDDLVRGATAAIDRVVDNERLYAKLDGIRGSLFAKAGDYTRAIELEQRALARWEATNGDFDSAIARLHNNLGWAHHMNGDIADARAHYERSLAIKEALVGPDNPDLATTLHNLGMLAREQRDLDTARQRLERALALTVASVGDAHPRVANVLSELAGTLVELGDHDAARAAAERGLAIVAGAQGDHAALEAELRTELKRVAPG